MSGWSGTREVAGQPRRHDSVFGLINEYRLVAQPIRMGSAAPTGSHPNDLIPLGTAQPFRDIQLRSPGSVEMPSSRLGEERVLPSKHQDGAVKPPGRSASASATALVTGVGHRIGVGAAVAERLAQDGFDVAFTCWAPYDERMPWGSDQSTVDQLTAGISGAGARCVTVAVDLEDPASVPTLVMSGHGRNGEVPRSMDEARNIVAGQDHH